MAAKPTRGAYDARGLSAHTGAGPRAPKRGMRPGTGNFGNHKLCACAIASCVSSNTTLPIDMVVHFHPMTGRWECPSCRAKTNARADAIRAALKTFPPEERAAKARTLLDEVRP
jgi:hypothetical protein